MTQAAHFSFSEVLLCPMFQEMVYCNNLGITILSCLV